METHGRLVLHLLLLFIFAVVEVRLVCVDVPSDGEAIVGKVKKLTCIYCMKREEILATTKVEWFYTGQHKNKTKTLIYLYDREPQEPKDADAQWKGRVTWTGSKDMQDVSISILNVTLNDTGTYECEVTRFFEFDSFKLSANKNIVINLKVNMREVSEAETSKYASEDITALYSEIMMYVLLVFLTFWLLVEMVYCYRKISKSDEQVQDTAY
ncbi:sodium channel subunit beta-3 isoform X3 [Danio aesculapii]|uniref:sodium channel subunit beta-3 isoform X3 n=1 Tax=Danio aesculapii TaxID=1142201 RepID=UPI0024C0144D|nr:sodium channel subunit beta-3 isoform X3 [Danio aesculapii]